MWKDDKVGNLCAVGDGAHASIERAESGILYLSSKNFKKGSLELSQVDYISPIDYNKHFKETKAVTKPIYNDLLLGIIGSLGSPYIVKEGEVIGISSSVAIIRPGNSLNPQFLFYYLTSDWAQDYIEAIKSGAAQGFISLDMLKSIPVKYPPLPLQQRIAAVLGRYDALLENYQQQVAVLEGLAQEVYREWFVRGRCPGDEAGPEGELPAGWRIATLDEVAYDTRRIVKIDDIDPDTAYVGLEHLSVKSISITATGTPDDISSDKLAFEEGDILFGKIRAYLHKVCLAHFAGVCSTDAIVIRPRIKDALSFVLFTVFSERFIEYADLISNGTKMPRSEWSVLKTYQIILPDNRALAAFEEVARPMLDKIANIQKQSNYLRATRDALLPRLLSGQLTVHEAEVILAN